MMGEDTGEGDTHQLPYLTITGESNEWTPDNDGALHPLPVAEGYAVSLWYSGDIMPEL